MSYSISISGHKDMESPEAGKAFEEEIAAKAREFVSNLEGATYANATFGLIGAVNLLVDAAPTASADEVEKTDDEPDEE